ncbi:osmoprotectant transport system ATP-binding protein [Lentibacillus persicus]|uniref:Quaternary amine transport ATP-binding protein n=1 Tax=Lentibacillus persicus TaxID=640948 RepID=A0A1I1W1K3_9BACI|nr:betaine/proline/choline family ABC transporter ATP-binding protein [Lentibacillus persicus]SFD88899.1 osmoprotectant transport system ATP-binding protein [Lentibacillus persicus]
MIQLQNVNKTYDDGFEALKDINLEFQEEKINVLIGPSGCGKTTTMKLLNRLTDHTSGEILMNGKNIKEIDPIELRRQMGYVIQNIGLFPHMTIYDNVAAVPKLLKWDKKTIKQKVDALLNMVNLDPEIYRTRYPSELSGGQQQRIGVIRALAAEPDTILMDEPFSALDPISREQLQDELVHLQQEINKTIVFVTHDMDEAIKIADQIILMEDGNIVQKGTPNELVTNPVNDFVKDFIGTKRLKNNQSMPQLSSIKKAFPSITKSKPVEDAIKIMVEKQISYLPVVEEDNKYKGIINLYDALSHKDGYVHEITNTTSNAVNINSDAAEATRIISGSGAAFLPLLSDTQEYLGVVDNQALLKSFEGFFADRGGEI